MEIVRNWYLSIDRDTVAYVRLVDRFDYDICDKIDRGEAFIIKYESDAIECEKCLTQYYNRIIKLDKDEVGSHVTNIYVEHIRYAVTRYINMIETSLMGWHHGIASREALEQQFVFLHDERKNWFMLNNSRKAAGEEHYPALSTFLSYLEKKRKKSENPEPPLG